MGKKEAAEESTVQANKAPDTQQPGVSEANQDYEQFRAETPEAQDEAHPSATEPSTITGDVPTTE